MSIDKVFAFLITSTIAVYAIQTMTIVKKGVCENE